MTAELLYERRRMTTVRSFWIVVLLFVGAAVGFAWLFAATIDEATARDVVQIHTQLGWVLVLVIGAMAIGPEYTHGTIRLALTEFPRRGRLFAAKAGVGATIIACLGVLAWAVGWVISGLLLADAGQVDDLLTTLARNLGFLVGWGLIGFATAAIVRSSALGVVIPLVFALIGENLIPFLLRRPELVEYFPFYGSQQLLGGGPDGGWTDVWSGTTVFAVWIAVLVAAAWALFRYRDA